MQNNFNARQQPLPEIVLNPIRHLSSMRKGYRRMLNDLLKKAAYMPYIAFSQATIGKHSGNYTREYTNKGLAVLEEMGFIVSQYQYFRTKTYRLSTYFLIPGVRLMLARLLPALAICINFQFTLIRSNSLFINSSNLTTSKRQSTKKENNLQVVRVSSIKERRGGMRPIGQIFNSDEFEISENQPNYHRTNPRKTTSYSSQTIQRGAGGQDQEFPKKGNSYSNYEKIDDYWAQERQTTQKIVESFKPPRLTFDEAMQEINILEKAAASPEMQKFIRLMGEEDFKKQLKAQCDQVLSRVDFDKK